MEYDDSFYKMIKDIQRQMTPFKDFEHIYGSAFKDISQSLVDRENFLRNLVPDIQHRYQSFTELAQREVARYKEIEPTSKHMTEIANATSIVSDFLKDQKSLTQMAKEAIGTNKYWQTELDMYKSFSNEEEAYRLALKAHYSDVAELSLIAHEHIRLLRWDEIGCTFNIPSELMLPVESSFSEMLKSYAQVFQSFKKAEYKMASFPPFVSKLPPVEIITGSDLLKTISEKEREEPPEESREVEDRIVEDIEQSLEELLARLDPHIISLWEGAKQALKSDNTDRSRHVIVSLREMVTHILHQIAPDEDIRSWTANQLLYSGDRPTRKARLLFICRGVNHDPFQRFVNRDVSAHLELIQLLQRGTHELSINLTEEQLKALVLRTESLLRFILVIWNSNN